MDKQNSSDTIIYNDGELELNVSINNETVWLNRSQISELLGRDVKTIGKHINNVFSDNELEKISTVANFATVQNEGGRDVRRDVEYYNLDVIISVGYRVKSQKGVRFRQWATARLKEYIVKGFTMNDELLKNAGGGNYFEELLERIRDIRSSEKVFWRKVLDIFSTSIDYDPNAKLSIQFFQTVQNKMHWAVHGNTAAEIVYQRADSTKPNMGMLSLKGTKPTIYF